MAAGRTGAAALSRRPPAPADAARACLAAFINGQTGAGSPNRQGLSAIRDGLDPLNVLRRLSGGDHKRTLCGCRHRTAARRARCRGPHGNERRA